MATPPIFGPAINPNYNNQPAVDFANSPLMRDLRALGNSLSNYRDAAARRYFTSSLPDDASMLAKQVEQFRQAAVFPFAAAGDLVSSGATAARDTVVPPAIEIAKGITGSPSIGSSAAPTASTTVPDLQLDAINDATQLSRQVDDTPSIDPAVVAGDNDAAKQNWFDTINSKVDLMAMGAAMLANSGSGMGTAANLGKGLQAGIASRAGQEKAAKDQQMAEALLLIRQQEALAKMAGDRSAADRLKNFTAARSVLSSLLQGAGAEEGADVAAEQIIALAPTAIANLPPQMLQRLTAYVTEKAGDNWFSSGGDIDQKKVQPAVLEFLQSLRGAR